MIIAPVLFQNRLLFHALPFPARSPILTLGKSTLSWLSTIAHPILRNVKPHDDIYYPSDLKIKKIKKIVFALLLSDPKLLSHSSETRSTMLQKKPARCIAWQAKMAAKMAVSIMTAVLFILFLTFVRLAFSFSNIQLLFRPWSRQIYWHNFLGAYTYFCYYCPVVCRINVIRSTFYWKTRFNKQGNHFFFLIDSLSSDIVKFFFFLLDT